MRKTAMTRWIEGLEVGGEQVEIEGALALAFDGHLAWSEALVEAALFEAAETYRAWRVARCELGPAGFRSCMPDVVREASQSYGWEHETDRVLLPAPTGAAIARADRVFVWLGKAGLSRGERRIVWARASTTASFADIGHVCRVSKWTAKRYYSRAIQKMLRFAVAPTAKSC